MTGNTDSDGHEERLGALADEMQRYIDEADDGHAAARDLALFASDLDNMPSAGPTTEAGETMAVCTALVHGLLREGDGAYSAAYKKRDGTIVVQPGVHRPGTGEAQELAAAAATTCFDEAREEGIMTFVDKLARYWTEHAEVAE